MTSAPLAALLLATVATAGPPAPAATGGPVHPDVLGQRPTLILLVVIDQLRSDTLTRLQDRFLPARVEGHKAGGFRCLMQDGAWFPQAQYDVAHALTAPGHATVVTGAYAYRTGIILNRWWDEEQACKAYCVGHGGYQGVGTKPPEYVRGTAPTNLKATTIGDSLKMAGHPTRVVSVSLKDRAAILMGGHGADVALWWDHGATQWQSSTYYEPDGKLPPWADALNKDIEGRVGAPVALVGTGAGSGRSDGGDKGMRFEGKVGDYEALMTGFGVQLTVDAAIAAADNMGLGRGAGPDLLAVSFAPLDYLGHEAGWHAREMEELVVAHDRELSRLLQHLDATVPGGLRNVTIALTGDHGGPATRDFLASHRVPHGHIDDAKLLADLNAHMVATFRKPKGGGDWFLYVAKLNFYLDREAANKSKHGVEALEDAAAEYLRGHEAVAHVFTRADALAGRYPPGRFGVQARHSYQVGRSGDVVAVPWPYWTVGEEPVIHMTGYSYDRYVPLLLVGRAFRAGVYATDAEVIDLAPTLAFITGVAPPSMSEGRVLYEAFRPAP